MSNGVRKMRRVKAATEEGITTVTIVDSTLIDSEVVRDLGEELYSLVDELGHRKIILDCSNVAYISSAALNKLIILEKKVAGADGQLVLCGLTPAVSDVFAVTRLNQRFNIQRDRGTATKCM